MKVHLKRTTSLEFEFINSSGQAQTVIIPGVTVGRYREALLCEVNVPEDETPEQVQERLVRQCKILCADRSDFVDQLDPTQLREVINALIGAYAGMDPVALLEVQRSVKKKMLLSILLPPSTDSTTATS